MQSRHAWVLLDTLAVILSSTVLVCGTCCLQVGRECIQLSVYTPCIHVNAWSTICIQAFTFLFLLVLRSSTANKRVCWVHISFAPLPRSASC